MDIDDRIERLTARHESLAQVTELMIREGPQFIREQAAERRQLAAEREKQAAEREKQAQEWNLRFAKHEARF